MLSAFLLTGTGFEALADVVKRSDGNDLSNPLDIKWVQHAHGEDGDLVHAIGSFGEWDAKALGENKWRMWIEIDTRGGRAAERLLDIFYKEEDHRLHGKMYGGDNLRQPIPGKIRVTRKGKDRVRVAFSRRLLGKGVTTYSWFAIVTSSQICPAGESCFDRAPDQGSITHEL